MIEDGCAPSVPQWEGGATYDQLWQKKELAEVCVCVCVCECECCVCVCVCVCVTTASFLTLPQINWDQPALKIHNFVRGNDKIPGAWTTIDGKVHVHVHVCTCTCIDKCTSTCTYVHVYTCTFTQRSMYMYMECLHRTGYTP